MGLVGSCRVLCSVLFIVLWRGEEEEEDDDDEYKFEEEEIGGGTSEG